MAFTPEELAEMAAADAEIEAEFCMTQEEIDDSWERDYFSRVDNKEKEKQSHNGIKAFRKQLGLTQTEFALLAGVSQATVSNWENIFPPRNWREIIAKVRELHDLEGMGAH